jgi:hypothetical protein
MITPNDNRCFEFSLFNHFVKGESKPVTLTEANPANPSRKSLKDDSFLRHVYQVVKVRIIRNKLFDFCVGSVKVFRIS